MATDWFILSPKNGELRRSKPPRKPGGLHWTEWDVENLVALNPSFLDLADHLPLRLGGVGGPAASPDQVYVDELGRIVVVEVKSVTAGLDALAQAIAYADHWRLLPPGEIGEAFRFCEDRKSHGKSGSKPRQQLARAVVQAFASPGGRQCAPDIESFARAHWRGGRLPLIGAPARIIVVAPDFDDECRRFAKSLARRMVGIELVRVRVVKAPAGIFVERQWIHRDPNIEPTWRLLRRVWTQPEIRERFAVNGWADGLNRDSFSLSARRAHDARLWLSASESEAEVCTCFPDNWCKGDPKRESWRKQFLKALPPHPRHLRQFLFWDFELPAQQRGLDDCILAVANAVHSVLVQEATTHAAQFGQGKAYPDFAARQKEIFGSRTPRLNVAEILREQRSRF